MNHSYGINFRPMIIIHRKITWLLLFSVFSLAFVSWLIYLSKRNIEETNFRIDQTYDIIGTVQQLTNSVSESEAGAYRYLESGDRGTGLRLGASREKLEQGLKRLQLLTTGNGDQRNNIAALRQYLLEKKSFEDSLYMPAGAKPGDKGRNEAAARADELNAAIKGLLGTMTLEETNLLDRRKLLNEIANRKTAYGLVIGRIAGFLFVVIILIQLNKDITRRKKTQEDLILAIKEAGEARHLQEQFLANMSHEIRTPMNGVKGMTELLLGTPLSEKQLEFAGIIKSSVNNLLVIINDILDFSKIKAGKLTIEKIDFTLRDILTSVEAIFEHRLKKKGLTLCVDLDPEIPDRLTGDPYRLNQILINLLGNAVKFTDQGRIHIGVTLLRRSAREAVVSFTIADTGIGISKDNLPYIFDSFSQAGQDISRLYGGTGLGLTICKQLLHLQGGDISVTSEPGKGSLFSFYLPYGYSGAPGREKLRTESLPDYSSLLLGKRFLIVEDNEVSQKLIDHVLKKAGGTTLLVNNGVEALRHIQDGKVFDLIIMDLQMPEMDGYAATRIIRGRLGLQTPIIAMTATATKREQLLCLEAGMNEYMTKPFEFDELYKKIGGLLQPVEDITNASS
jgi:signal transduction histidine kinase/CheY-like chemotaxis protein